MISCLYHYVTFLYKIIDKILDVIMENIFSNVILQEQFGFLARRHIFKEISATQEGLHTTKGKKCIFMVLKLDFSKAYEKVS
jgi:hypothetical protein